MFGLKKIKNPSEIGIFTLLYPLFIRDKTHIVKLTTFTLAESENKVHLINLQIVNLSLYVLKT